jgi:hypothetical protein
VLLGYFFPIEPLLKLRSSLLDAAVLLAAVALLLGVFNLLTVHLNKVSQGSSKALYSFTLIVALVITFAITLLQGPDGSAALWVFEYIQVPVETSLMAVLAVSLAYATVHLLRRKPGLFTVIFVGVVFLTLAGAGPMFGIEIPFISDKVADLLTEVFASAGARGLLIGVGLGTVATGLRILMGADRPFGG